MTTLAIIVAIPFYIAGFAWLTEHLGHMSGIQKGIAEMKAVSTATHALQTERGLSMLRLEDGIEPHELATNRRRTDVLRERLLAPSGEQEDHRDTASAAAAALYQDLGNPLGLLRHRVDRNAVTAVTTFDQYTLLVQRSLDSLSLIAGTRLADERFATRLHTYQSLERLKEMAGTERGYMGLWLAAGRPLDASQRERWELMQTWQQNLLMEAVYNGPRQVLDAYGQFAVGEQAKVEHLRARIRAGAPVDPHAWFEQSSSYLAMLAAITDATLDDVGAESELVAVQMKLLAVVLALLLAAAAALFFHYTAFTRRRVLEPLQRLYTVATEFEHAPDSPRRAAHPHEDEIGALSRAFNRAVDGVQTAQRDLATAKEHYATLVEHSLVGVYQIGNGRLTYINPQFAEIFGYRQEELADSDPLILVAPEDRARVAQQMAQDLREQRAESSYEFTGLCRAGKRLFIEARATVIEQDGRPITIGMCQDMSARRQAELERELASKAFESSRQGIIVTDAEHRIQRVNTAFEQITGYTAEGVLGRRPQDFLKSGRQNAAFYEAMWLHIRQNDCWEGEIWNRRKNGEIYPEWLAIDTIRGKDGQAVHYVGVFTDISRAKVLDARVTELSFYDPLTHLPNRRLIQQRLDEELARVRANRELLAVLFLDLDNFKKINDTLGHHIGDEILRQAAERLRTGLRAGRDGRARDIVGRFGGDEFVAIITGLSRPDEARAAAESILRRFTEPVKQNEQPFRLTVSIGIAIFPHDADTAMALLRHADLAMYDAKHAGRNAVRFYQPRLEEEIESRLWIENNVPEAITHGELVLYYQPQVSFVSGRMTGVEALLRWRHPRRGVIPPGKFIPVLEETGLIAEVGAWIVERACAQLAQWRAARIVAEDFSMAVNISGHQLYGPDLPEWMAVVLDRHKVPPANLVLELTESVATEHIEAFDEAIAQLRKLGTPLAIDDFGTGHLSLARLYTLGSHWLKIDQSFVRNLAHDSAAQTIVRSTITLAHGMGLRTIAEGVETTDQHRFLHQLKCDEFQGYLVAPPLPPEELEPLLRRPRVFDAHFYPAKPESA